MKKIYILFLCFIATNSYCQSNLDEANKTIVKYYSSDSPSLLSIVNAFFDSTKVYTNCDSRGLLSIYNHFPETYPDDFYITTDLFITRNSLIESLQNNFVLLRVGDVEIVLREDILFTFESRMLIQFLGEVEYEVRNNELKNCLTKENSRVRLEFKINNDSENEILRFDCIVNPDLDHSKKKKEHGNKKGTEFK